MSAPTLNEQSEKWLVGALLADPSLITQARDFNPLDLFDDVMRTIFRTQLAIDSEGHVPTLTAVAQRMESNGTLTDVDGGLGLLSLSNDAPYVEHVSEWCEIIRRAAMRRRLRAEAVAITRLADDPGVDDETLLKRFNNAKLPTQPPEQLGKPRLCRQSERFESFPTWVFPAPMRKFVTASAEAIDCDESYIGLPALSVLAASIGNTRRLILKRSWTEPSIIWTALVGNSGTRKSPPIEAASGPMRDRQAKAFKLHSEAMQGFDRELAEYNSAIKKYRGEGEPPLKPEEPVCERFVANDLTIEGLVYLLKHQPRGLLICRDELDGWLGGFDQYKSGKGSDLANWLELHGGRSLTIDRKTGTQRTLHIPRAAASLCGGIQPGVLSAKINTAHVASGLVARILFAFPPPRPRRWTEADVDDRITNNYSRLVENLHTIPFDTDEDGQPEPALVGLTVDAKRRFARFVNEHGAQQADLNDSMSATFSKLEGYAARFALVLHLARWASGEPVDPTVCDEADIEAGIVLSSWFANEAKRVHGMLSETSAESELRQLAEWVSRRGGRASVRDIVRLNRKYPTADEAESALCRLVDTGAGSWREIPTQDVGGRPTREFCQRIADETPVNSLGNEGCVGNSTEEIPQRASVDTEVPDLGIDFDQINNLFGARGTA